MDTQHGVTAAAARAVITDNTKPPWFPGFQVPNDLKFPQIMPQLGITSTPVIDASSNTMYVESFSCEGNGPLTTLSCVNGAKNQGIFRHRLHALDITSGAEKFGGPATIAAPGFNSNNSTNGNQMARPGLLLSNGTIYIGYGSDGGDAGDGPFQGWVFAYDATDLTKTPLAVFPTTGTNGEGSVWMAGAGLAADSSGNLFIATGNGTFDTTLVNGFPASGDFGDSILKLSFVTGNLSVSDYFTPANQANLNANDIDLGSGGVLLLPDQAGTVPHVLIQVGKEGTIRVVNRDNMGKYCGPPGGSCSASGPDTNILQELPPPPAPQPAVGGMWSMPAYWNNNVYFWGCGDFGCSPNSMQAFSLSNGVLSSSPFAVSADAYGYPGANMSVSANGSTNGIVWALGTRSGVWGLRAYDATTLATLYSNNCDNLGGAVKFAVPTVANGKVYVGSATQLTVYGTGVKAVPCWWPAIQDLLQTGNSMM